MTSRRSRVVVTLVLGAATVCAAWYFFGPANPVGFEKEKPAFVSATPSFAAAPRAEGQAAREFREAGQPALNAVTPLALARPEDRSPLADSLNAPEHNGMQDLTVVLDLFEHYREKFGGLPTGEGNAQIVNALTGNNPRRVALLDRSHPAINAQGELTDRWGTALFFHLVSHDALEIRSAGPDKEMWNGDDLLLQSPSLRAPPRAP